MMCISILSTVAVINITRCTVGQYCNTMTLGVDQSTTKNFKCGKERVMVATGAFGFDVDTDNVSEIILFDLPDNGSELV